MPLKDGNQLARMTDATIITTLCSKNDVDELIAACKKYNFYGTIGPRCWLPYMVAVSYTHLPPALQAGDVPEIRGGLRHRPQHHQCC